MRPVLQWLLALHRVELVTGEKGTEFKGFWFCLHNVPLRRPTHDRETCPLSQRPSHPQSEKSECFSLSQDRHLQVQGVYITLVQRHRV